jgi:hypothetical protein
MERLLRKDFWILFFWGGNEISFCVTRVEDF